MANVDFQLRYYFDPLCGWCYASASALAGLAARFPQQLSLRPTGLFMNSRPVAVMADHAWRNDQRIAELTGQQFSEDYHRDVLLSPDGVFDSTALTEAVVALGEIDSKLEPRFLHAAQLARYVEGRDTSRADEVMKVATALLVGSGRELDAATFAALLADESFRQRVTDRVAAAQSEMAQLPTKGVPQIVLAANDRRHILNGQDLYSGSNVLLERIDQLLQMS